jgi:hypothetical protein
MKRVRSAIQNTPLHKDAEEKRFMDSLKKWLTAKGYRADLKMIAVDGRPKNRFSVTVRYAKELKLPTERDLMAIAAESYPQHEIDWPLTNVDQDDGIIMLVLTPSVESIPVESIEKIPPEFKAIGTGLYKRAADSTGNVHEIWTLRKGDEGLVLYRNQDDLEVKAEEEGLKAGDVVQTPYGPGRISKFDEGGNAFVQIAGSGKVRLVAKTDMVPYDQSKEKAKLKEYYEVAFGDADLAESMTRDFSDVTNPFTKKKEKK